MDLIKAMQTFAKVAELGSFSRAAEALDLPNATVSQRVSQLEEHLGVKLLVRTTRRVSLSDEGTAYFDWSQRLLGEITEVEDRLRGRVGSPRGRIRVDVPASAGRHVIAPALPGFLERYPGITVELGSSDRPVDLILESVDCVIRGGNVLDESLVARKLGEFPVITCASPAYLGRFGTPASPQALEGHRAVNFFSAKTGKAMPLDFTIDGRVEETPLPHRVGTNDADTYRALVVEGLGIGQFPSSGVVLDALADGRLVRILEAWDPEPFPLFVMYPRNRHLSVRVRAFVDWAMALYAEVFRGGPPSASVVAGR